MRARILQDRRSLTLGLLLLAMIAYVAASLVSRVSLLLAGAGDRSDFRTYWYFANVLRQGDNPYQAALENWGPSVPIHYLDGVTAQEIEAPQVGQAHLPSNTAPMMFLFSGLAFFSWPVAKLLWLATNLALMLAAPWLVMRLIPAGSLGRAEQALVALSFYGFQATKLVLGTGQTTLLVLVVLTGALLLARRQSWLLAGVLLGLGLSKYSLALPFFLLLAYKRQWRVLAVGVGVQVAGWLGLAVLAGNSALDVLHSYVQIALAHAGTPGIHLAMLLGAGGNTLLVSAIVLSTVVLGFLWRMTHRLRRADGAEIDRSDLLLLAVMVLWSLLVAYHRLYDAAVAIFFVAVFAEAVVHPAAWRLSDRTRVLALVGLAIFVGVMIMPRFTLADFLPRGLVPTWLDLADALYTVVLVGALALSMWLGERLTAEAEPTDAVAASEGT